MPKKEMKSINLENQRLLLSLLDPARKDIIVVEIKKPGFMPTGYNVINNNGQTIFSVVRTEMEKNVAGSRFPENFSRFTIDINDIKIVCDSDSINQDTAAFLENKLKEALESKVHTQRQDEKLQKARETMSAYDKEIQTYLQNILQRQK